MPSLSLNAGFRSFSLPPFHPDVEVNTQREGKTKAAWLNTRSNHKQFKKHGAVEQRSLCDGGGKPLKSAVKFLRQFSLNLISFLGLYSVFEWHKKRNRKTPRFTLSSGWKLSGELILFSRQNKLFTVFEVFQLQMMFTDFSSLLFQCLQVWMNWIEILHHVPTTSLQIIRRYLNSELRNILPSF